MSVLRRILLPAALVLVALTAGAPAMADPATPTVAGAAPLVVNDSAYADINSDDTHNTRLTVDMETVNGTTTLDVEWSSTTCQTDATGWQCTYRVRPASGVTPSGVDFSLSAASVAAQVTYTEFGYTCAFQQTTGESCTEAVPVGTGTTGLAVTWTATGAPSTTTYRDGQTGQVYVRQNAWATVTAEGFGEVFADRPDVIAALGSVRIVEPPA